MVRSPKECKCGEQGAIVDSRQHSEYVRRRYLCGCGECWTTSEIRVDATLRPGIGGMREAFSTSDREYVADKLIELAQELLKCKR